MCLENVPWKNVQKLAKLANILDNISKDIYRKKMDGLAKGDDAVTHQVGQGKDIMSVLRECTCVPIRFVHYSI